MRDGWIGDDCFVCGWLWPHARPCPRCRGSASWNHARLMDDAVVTVRVLRAYDEWRLADDVFSLAALLTAIYVDLPSSLEVAAEHGIDIERLRRAWQRAAPDQAPDD